MTFEQWAALTPSMSVAEKMVARIAWVAAIDATVQLLDSEHGRRSHLDNHAAHYALMISARLKP